MCRWREGIRGNMMRSSIQICERRRYNTGIRTYMGRPGFSAADVCFTIRYGRAQAPAEISLSLSLSLVLQKIRGLPPPISLSGFLIAFLFSLRATEAREVECTKEKRKSPGRGVDIDIWFRISGSNQIRSRTTAATPI